jgi:phosphate starvation-inducible protein PhoH
LTEKKIPLAGVDVVQLLGFNDANLQMLEERFDANLTVRGDQLTIQGSQFEIGKIEGCQRTRSCRTKRRSIKCIDTVIDLIAVNVCARSSRNREKMIPQYSTQMISQTKDTGTKFTTTDQKSIILRLDLGEEDFYRCDDFIKAGMSRILWRPAVKAGKLGSAGDFADSLSAMRYAG